MAHCIATGKGQELELEGGSSTSKSQVVFYDRGEVQLLVVGHEDGSIQVFSVSQGADTGAGPRCRLLANIKTQAKLIQSLALHPQHSADGSPAQFCNYLASASNEFPVHVFDLTSVLQQLQQPGDSQQAAIVVTPHLALAGHLQRVIEVAWSPHQPHLLASCSYDWSVQVHRQSYQHNTYTFLYTEKNIFTFYVQIWDVRGEGCALHNFSGHGGRVMTVSWHPTSEDLVLSGAEDGTLHVWRPDQQPRQLPVERKKEKKVRRVQDASKRQQEESPKEAESTSEEAGPVKETKELSFDELLALHKAEQSKSKESTPSEAEERADCVEQPDSVEKSRSRLILKPSSNRERKVKTGNKKLHFPVTSAAETKRRSQAAEDCEAVHRHYQSQQCDEAGEPGAGLEAGPPHLGYFTSREAMYRLLEVERKEQAGDGEAEAVLSLWGGDLHTVIEAAIAEARVTERLLGHAAGVSVQLWRRAAASLGRQLVREGEVSSSWLMM